MSTLEFKEVKFNQSVRDVNTASTNQNSFPVKAERKP